MEIWKRFPREEAELYKSKAIYSLLGRASRGSLASAMLTCACCPVIVPLARLGFRSLG